MVRMPNTVEFLKDMSHYSTQRRRVTRRSSVPLFFSWYANAEPSCFSGLWEFPDPAIQTLYDVMEKRVEAHQLDSETLDALLL